MRHHMEPTTSKSLGTMLDWTNSFGYSFTALLGRPLSNTTVCQWGLHHVTHRRAKAAESRNAPEQYVNEKSNTLEWLPLGGMQHRENTLLKPLVENADDV
ncbi:hypothetical protein OUZ56_019801 [Daphnia magna]|uniref:Uncharacterized protein n=1 Tax=Daphnia magna TaxID=35525 RepID=A0ABQ9ZCN2_9CRUS|nr:hypothetical protein OUZ56_019801 [Daphnia magna]